MNDRINLYEEYLKYSLTELLEFLKEGKTEEEKNFYANLYNFKLAISARKIIERDKI